MRMTPIKTLYMVYHLAHALFDLGNTLMLAAGKAEAAKGDAKQAY